MNKTKKICIYLVCSLLIFIYMFTLSLVLKDEYTYSYRMYYLESKTKYWYGNDGLVVNFGETYNYSVDFDIDLKDVRYLGDDLNFVCEKIDNSLQIKYVELLESSTIYFEIENYQEINSYKIILEVEELSDIYFDFYLNGEKVEIGDHSNKLILNIENVKKENSLNIKSSKNVRLNSLCFEEM